MGLFPNRLLQKIRFILRKGPQNYIASGRQYFNDLEDYITQLKSLGMTVDKLHLDPRIEDSSTNHPLTKSVMEASFTSEMIREMKPEIVSDIGSDLVFLATLSSFVNVNVVDTRDIQLIKQGLFFKKSDARRLPFENEECEFITSLCVVEHIGLGRYGDTIDPLGDSKFMDEVYRCLRNGGYLIFSVPVSKKAQLIFNSHRLYSIDQLDTFISRYSIIKERFIKSRHDLMPRIEALNHLSVNKNNYMIWIGCLQKGAGL